MSQSAVSVAERLLQSLEGMVESLELLGEEMPDTSTKCAVMGFFDGELERAREVIDLARASA